MNKQLIRSLTPPKQRMLDIGLLPEELLIGSLSHLDYRDLVFMRLVSHYWARVIDGSERLRYIVWLGIHGKSDGRTDGVLMDKIKALLKHAHNWLYLDPVQRDHGFGDSSTPQYLELCGADDGVVLRSREDKLNVRVGKLSSALSSADSWLGDPLELPSTTVRQECALDPLKDLLVVPTEYLTWEIRSLSSPSSQHPITLCPRFDAHSVLPGTHRPLTDGGKTVMIVGDWVVTSLTGIGENFICIFAWHWVTGKFIFRLVLPKVTHVKYNVDGLIMISSSCFVLPVTHADSDYREDALQVYEFTPSDYSSQAVLPRLTRTFALPNSRRYMRGGILWTRGTNSHSTLWDNRDPEALDVSNALVARRGKPFYEGNSFRMCGFVWRTVTTKDEGAYLYLTHSNTFTSYKFNEYFEAAPDEPIPWSVWGVSHGACLYGRHLGHKELWDTHGDRVVILEPEWPRTHVQGAAATLDPSTTARPAAGDNPHSPMDYPRTAPAMWRIVVLDFNQYRVRRAMNPNSWPVDKLDSSTSGRSPLRPPRVMRGVQRRPREDFLLGYDTIVEAGMPYIETVYSTKLVQTTHPSVRINDEHIILNYDTLHGWKIEVLTF